VALRRQLWLALPLSNKVQFMMDDMEGGQLGEVPKLESV
jgi:hypothetical protein